MKINAENVFEAIGSNYHSLALCMSISKYFILRARGYIDEKHAESMINLPTGLLICVIEEGR